MNKDFQVFKDYGVTSDGQCCGQQILILMHEAFIEKKDRKLAM